MLNPVHKLKKFVRYTGNEKPDASYVTEVSGWLASGKLDANGKEIFEGDRVKNFDGREFTVKFRRGTLYIYDGDEPFDYLCAYEDGEFEIIGHITDEEINDARQSL